MFSQRKKRQAEITLRGGGTGYMTFCDIGYPLLDTEKCFWAFSSIDELREILRGERA
jgi:hypothetical protein